MALFSELLGLVRLATGLRACLRHVISPEEAQRLVRRWVDEREPRFLRALERAVFDNRRSPYRALLEHAGCERGDLAGLVARDGVEGTLARLSASGVFVTWEEFKGRAAAVRGSRTFRFAESDFDSPLITTHYRVTSGGTTGRPVRVRIDLEEHAQAAPDWAVLFAAHGWLGRPLVFWTPTHTGMANRYLRCARFGARYAAWFAMADPAAPLDRLRAAAVHRVARRAAGLPAPVAAPIDRAARVGDYLADLLAGGLAPVVNTSPSAAARLALEEAARGRSLSGVSFLLGAEPLTPERRATIEASGAAAVSTYGTSECGWIGAQFPGATRPDEVSIFRDAYAVVTRADPDGDGPGQPLLFTNLRPAAPKILLNTEVGDSGVLEDGATHPLAAALGYTVRLHTIRSFRKITAWGTTFAQADLYHVLEDALPRRFGGSLADYQLAELAGGGGMPSLVLRVSPGLGPIAEDDLRATLVSELNRTRSYYRPMTQVIAQAGALRIERRTPVPTARGKVLPVVSEFS